MTRPCRGRWVGTVLAGWMVATADARAAEVVCEPQGPGESHPMTYWYDVTPVPPDEEIYLFRVETEDLFFPGPFFQPPGWTVRIQRDLLTWEGWVVWESDVPLPQGTHRFGFVNDHPPGWRLWETDDDSAFAPRHVTQEDGLGRLIHAPITFFGGDGPGGAAAPCPVDPQTAWCGEIRFSGMSDELFLDNLYFTRGGTELPGESRRGRIGPAAETICLCVKEEPDDLHIAYDWPNDPTCDPVEHDIGDLDFSTAPTVYDFDLYCADTPFGKLVVDEPTPGSPRFCSGGVCGGVNPAVVGQFSVTAAADTDGDGVMDCLDGCPTPPGPLPPCIRPGFDTDGDGEEDACDAMPFDSIAGLCPCDGPLGTSAAWMVVADYEQCVTMAIADLVACGLDPAVADELQAAALDGPCAPAPQRTDEDGDQVLGCRDN